MSTSKRLTYEESCKKLGSLIDYQTPSLPAAMPTVYDTTLGVSFFKTSLERFSLDNLTLPRTFFGRSEISLVSFKNTDLSESNLCWNDFLKCDFTGATLCKSDLRCSIFVSVIFKNADLRDADLGRSRFENCIFEGAQMAGVILGVNQARMSILSKKQSREIDWGGGSEDEQPDG